MFISWLIFQSMSPPLIFDPNQEIRKHLVRKVWIECVLFLFDVEPFALNWANKTKNNSKPKLLAEYCQAAMGFYFNNSLGQVLPSKTYIPFWLLIIGCLARWLRTFDGKKIYFSRLLSQDDMQRMLDFLNDVHFFRATDTMARWRCFHQNWLISSSNISFDTNKSIYAGLCRLMFLPTSICSPLGGKSFILFEPLLSHDSKVLPELRFQRRDKLYFGGGT